MEGGLRPYYLRGACWDGGWFISGSPEDIIIIITSTLDFREEWLFSSSAIWIDTHKGTSITKKLIDVALTFRFQVHRRWNKMNVLIETGLMSIY